MTPSTGFRHPLDSVTAQDRAVAAFALSTYAHHRSWDVVCEALGRSPRDRDQIELVVLRAGFPIAHGTQRVVSPVTLGEARAFVTRRQRRAPLTLREFARGLKVEWEVAMWFALHLRRPTDDTWQCAGGVKPFWRAWRQHMLLRPNTGTRRTNEELRAEWWDARSDQVGVLQAQAEFGWDSAQLTRMEQVAQEIAARRTALTATQHAAPATARPTPLSPAEERGFGPIPVLTPAFLAELDIMAETAMHFARVAPVVFESTYAPIGG